MPSYSVSDQYCNFDTGNWHERVYGQSDTCESSGWWHWGNPVELTFTTDSCVAGFRLKECIQGPCPKEEEEDEDEEHEYEPYKAWTSNAL